MYCGQGSVGGHVSEKSRDNAYIPKGLRGFFSGQIGKHSLDAPASQTSHKSSGDNRVSCSCQDRQHNGGCIYQLPGGNAFVATAQFSPQADCLEHCALQHVVHDARPGSPECRSGSPFKGQSIIQRMGTSPADGRSDLEEADLFTSQANAKCLQYFSLKLENAPLGEDALAHPWSNMLLYALPPLTLIFPTLDRVRDN